VGHLGQSLAAVNLPTVITAALLVLGVILVIRIGKALAMAAILGVLAGGVSLGEGNPPGLAGTHAAVGFGVAVVTLFVVKMAKSLMLIVLVAAAGVAAVLIFGAGR
jgi:hypothetical protein